MTQRYFMGIDPGLHGAIALYAPLREHPLTVESLVIFDIPTYHIQVGKTKRLKVDKATLRMWLDLHGPEVIKALIEEPHAMPAQGVSSSFSFGKVCGMLEMGLAMATIPYILIDPAVWKRRLGLTADKDDTRRKASAALPTFAHLWEKKNQDGRAEAALLAMLCSKLDMP